MPEAGYIACILLTTIWLRGNDEKRPWLQEWGLTIFALLISVGWPVVWLRAFYDLKEKPKRGESDGNG